MSITENNIDIAHAAETGVQTLLRRLGFGQAKVIDPIGSHAIDTSTVAAAPEWWQEATVHSTRRNEDGTVTVDVNRVADFFSRCRS